MGSLAADLMPWVLVRVGSLLLHRQYSYRPKRPVVSIIDTAERTDFTGSMMRDQKTSCALSCAAPS